MKYIKFNIKNLNLDIAWGMLKTWILNKKIIEFEHNSRNSYSNKFNY